MSQIEILRYDKVTRLEGICIEELFYNTFLKRESFEVSNNWWISKQKDSSYHLVKHVLDKINLLDLEVASKFSQKNKVFFVKKIDDQFKYHPFSIRNNINDIDSGLLSGKTLPIKREKLTDKINDENAEYRMKKALAFLNSINSDLDKIIESRKLANFYGNSVMWDIDYFIKFRNRILALEVKQKYPSKKEEFGLNLGSYGILKFLFDSGFDVQHIILTKPKRDRFYSAVEFLQGNFRIKSKWLIHSFNENSFTSGISSSPEYTSFSQQKPLNHYSESTSNFAELGSVEDVKPSALLEYLENR